MVVIAAYDNIQVLQNLLVSMNSTDNLDEDVLIVCTDSSQNEMVDFVRTLPNNPNYSFNIKIDFTPYKGYDSGAYIYAYTNYISDYYIFLQDSIEIRSPEWFNCFKSYRRDNVITGWVLFDIGWDSHEQTQWVELKCKGMIYKSPVGIFGPMFQIKRDTLKILDEKYNLSECIPTSKVIEQQGMERLWPYMCLNSGIEINSIDGYYLNWDEKRYLTKHFLRRP